MSYEAYCTTATERVSIHQHQLNQISEKDELSLLERTAAERSLQILAEAAIGASKYANRKLGLPDRSDASSGATQLLEQYPCPGVTQREIKGAIGMRNAIVHDYLNLDWELIHQVIRDKQYLKLGKFVAHCCTLLCSNQKP